MSHCKNYFVIDCVGSYIFQMTQVTLNKMVHTQEKKPSYEDLDLDFPYPLLNMVWSWLNFSTANQKPFNSLRPKQGSGREERKRVFPDEEICPPGKINYFKPLFPQHLKAYTPL